MIANAYVNHFFLSEEMFLLFHFDGYEWQSRLAPPRKPRACPECKSRSWDATKHPPGERP